MELLHRQIKVKDVWKEWKRRMELGAGVSYGRRRTESRRCDVLRVTEKGHVERIHW